MTERHPGPWGIVSDAHGNPAGLAACLDALRQRGAQTVMFLGDAVGYLPLEGTVLDALAAVRAVCVSGNHEAMLLGALPVGAGEAIYRLGDARERLSPAHRRAMAAWPKMRTVSAPPPGSPEILLVHGGPRDPWRHYIYPDSDLSFVGGLGVSALICAHTHRPFVRVQDGVVVANVGSCGLPRDQAGLASCALLDPDSLAVEIIRCAYDVEALLQACRASGPPHRDVERVLRRRGTGV